MVAELFLKNGNITATITAATKKGFRKNKKLNKQLSSIITKFTSL
jgi:hypothetical protein